MSLCNLLFVLLRLRHFRKGLETRVADPSEEYPDPTVDKNLDPDPGPHPHKNDSGTYPREKQKTHFIFYPNIRLVKFI